MTKPHLLLRRSMDERRQLLQQHSPCRNNRMAEVAGGTTAEVAAVCCCLPAAVVDFCFLTMYKVPKGLYRNAVRRRRRRRLMQRHSSESSLESLEEAELGMHPAVKAAAERFMKPEEDKDLRAFEDEMWSKFYDSGFWRDPENKD